MAKSKKTINVEEIVNYGNKQLLRTDEYADEKFKSGICLMIGTILHNTNNYNGFMFIDNNDCEVGSLGYYTRNYTIKK